MAGFFKGLAKGLLYILFFPFGLLAIFLYAIFGLFVFIYQFIKLIVLFFTGRSLQSDLEEDIEVKKIIEKNSPKVEEEKELSMSVYPSDSIVYGGSYSSPYGQDEKKEEDNTNTEPEEESANDIEDTKEEEDDA